MRERGSWTKAELWETNGELQALVRRLLRERRRLLGSLRHAEGEIARLTAQLAQQETQFRRLTGYVRSWRAWASGSGAGKSEAWKGNAKSGA